MLQCRPGRLRRSRARQRNGRACARLRRHRPQRADADASIRGAGLCDPRGSGGPRLLGPRHAHRLCDGLRGMGRARLARPQALSREGVASDRNVRRRRGSRRRGEAAPIGRDQVRPRRCHCRIASGRPCREFRHDDEAVPCRLRGTHWRSVSQARRRGDDRGSRRARTPAGFPSGAVSRRRGRSDDAAALWHALVARTRTGWASSSIPCAMARIARSTA